MKPIPLENADEILGEMVEILEEFRAMSPEELERWARASIIVRFMAPLADRGLLDEVE